MVVYIFPTSETDAGKLEAKIKALKLQPINDPTVRETAKTVKKLQPTGEIDISPSTIIVDPELPFKPEDIAEDFSFGNGTTIAAVRLKTGEWVPCGWTVLPPPPLEETERYMLKKIFKGE